MPALTFVVLSPGQVFDEFRSAVDERVVLARLLLVDDGDEPFELGPGAERVDVRFDETDVGCPVLSRQTPLEINDADSGSSGLTFDNRTDILNPVRGREISGL